MQKSQRLKPLLNMAENKERDALQSLATVQKRLIEERSKLSQLIDYQKEYHINLDSRGRGVGINGMELHAFHNFMGKLDEIIKQQSEQIMLVEGQLSQSQKIFQDLHRKTESLQKLISKTRGREALQADRLEQKQYDELASRLYSKTLN